MSAPYTVGDRIRYRNTEYTVRAVYAAENGWELRAADDGGGLAWLDAADVEPVTEAVVDKDQGELF